MDEIKALLKEAKTSIFKKSLDKKKKKHEGVMDMIKKTQKVSRKLSWSKEGQTLEDRIKKKLKKGEGKTQFSNISNRRDTRPKAKKWSVEIVTMETIPIPKSFKIAGNVNLKKIRST